MGLESAIEKLDKYVKRLKKGKAQKIKPSHVEKVIAKLEAKAEQLRADLAGTDKESRQERIRQKLDLVGEQQTRARWLLDEIGKPTDKD